MRGGEHGEAVSDKELLEQRSKSLSTTSHKEFSDPQETDRRAASSGAAKRRCHCAKESGADRFVGSRIVLTRNSRWGDKGASASAGTRL